MSRRSRSLPATRCSLAAVGALALVLTGAACSGESGAGEASAHGPEAQAAAQAEAEAEPGSEAASHDASTARLARAEFRVEGMTCGGCALATEMAVKKLDGVESADAEYDEATDEGRCTVEYDPDRLTTDRIASAIEGAGFTPTLAADSSAGPGPPADEDRS